MKILYTNFHRGDGGGHTTYLITLATHLACEHDIFVAASATSRLHEQALQLAGVRVVAFEFSTRLWRLPALVLRLRALMRAQRFDVVHVNGSADHRCAMLARLLMGGKRPQIVYTKHDDRPPKGIGPIIRARFGTDHVIAVSKHAHRKLQASPYGRCGVTMVRNGIDTYHYFPYSAQATALARARWCGDSDARLVVGSNAGTADYKNWLDVVQAVSQLPAPSRSQVLILIAGSPPTPEQQERVGALGMTQQVVHAGLLRDVRPFIAALDVGFVVSTRIETISFACREMMAMGKPVVVTRHAGLPENINDGVDGWIVPPGSPTAIGRVLERLLADPSSLAAMSAAARQKSVREFHVQEFVGKTLQVYIALQVKRYATTPAARRLEEASGRR